MESIVLELQQESLSNKNNISDLLRKSYVVARKLNIPEFKAWLEKEMNGYSESDDIPDYRVIPGQLKGQHPLRGWQTIQGFMSSMKIHLKISELENDLNTSGRLALSIDDQTKNKIYENSNMRYKIEIVFFIDKSSVKGLIDTVRNIILNWTLKLEEDGILGEDMLFSHEEKEKAEKNQYIINNFKGIENVQIQQKSNDSKQIMIKREIDFEQIKELMELIKLSTDKNNFSDKNKDNILKEVKQINEELKNKKPKKNLINKGLSSLKNIFENSSSSLIVTSIINNIDKIISWF